MSKYKKLYEEVVEEINLVISQATAREVDGYEAPHICNSDMIAWLKSMLPKPEPVTVWFDGILTHVEFRAMPAGSKVLVRTGGDCEVTFTKQHNPTEVWLLEGRNYELSNHDLQQVLYGGY